MFSNVIFLIPLSYIFEHFCNNKLLRVRGRGSRHPVNLRVLEYITGMGELSYTRLEKIFSFYEAQRLVFGAEFCPLRIHTLRDFPGDSVVKNPLASAGTQVRSLVRELRPHMPEGK